MQPRLLRLIQVGFSMAVSMLPSYALPAFGAAQRGWGGWGPYRCYWTLAKSESPFAGGESHGGGTLQVASFMIEIKPDQDPTSMICHATIRSAKGEIVFEDRGEQMDVDAVTGKDVNGDGQPEAVIKAFSGGAHCCYTYFFVTLGAEPRLIQKFENNHPASFEDLNGDGHMEISLRDGDFDYFETAYAVSPLPLLIIHLQRNEFRDVSTDFQNIYDEEIHESRNGLNPKCVGEFLDFCEYGTTRGRVLRIVLSYLYSGRPQEAWKALDELWPAKDSDRIRTEILKRYCGGLRANIGVATVSPCNEK